MEAACRDRHPRADHAHDPRPDRPGGARRGHEPPGRGRRRDLSRVPHLPLRQPARPRPREPDAASSARRSPGSRRSPPSCGGARPSIEQVAIEVERVVRESAQPDPGAGRDRAAPPAPPATPCSADASRRCFVAYEGVAEAALEALQVPDAERHARSIVALIVRVSRCAASGPERKTSAAPPRRC